jgi:16S rRNA (guanine527-N7)-methyltransferase
VGEADQRRLVEAISPHVSITRAQAEALTAHFDLVKRWNRVINLTRVVEWKDAVTRHYGEAAILARAIGSGSPSIVDIGSGAGFPGIPLAILLPGSSITLVEGDQRKGAFLKEASRGITNCNVDVRRSTDVDGSFDWLVSRAVRWEDVEEAASRLAKDIAVLGGVEFPESTLIRWVERQAMPWGTNRAVLIGRVVSRGT